jgi:hypothetical protein
MFFAGCLLAFLCGGVLLINSPPLKNRLEQEIRARITFPWQFSFRLGRISPTGSVALESLVLAGSEGIFFLAGDCWAANFWRIASRQPNYSLACEHATVFAERLPKMPARQSAGTHPTVLPGKSFALSVSHLQLNYKDLIFRCGLLAKAGSTAPEIHLISPGGGSLDLNSIGFSPPRATLLWQRLPLGFILRQTPLAEWAKLVDGQLSGSMTVRLDGSLATVDFASFGLRPFRLDHRWLGASPLTLAEIRLEGSARLDWRQKSLHIDEMRLASQQLTTRFSLTIEAGKYDFSSHSEQLAMNNLVGLFATDPVFNGFDLAGELRFRLVARGNLHDENKLAEFSIEAGPEQLAQRSARLDYLKGNFQYEFVDKAGQSHPVPIDASRATFVRLYSLPRHVYGAVLTCEDAGFFRHKGIEFKEIERAIAENIAHKRQVIRGGSTITQQLVKNLFLTREKSLIRKIKEMLLTFELEATLPKARILEIYLNGIEWGPSIFGLGQAAAYYFHKSARDLSPKEAAYLASLIPNPTRYAGSFYKKELSPTWQARLAEILSKMLFFGHIDEAAYQAARVEPLSFESR